MGTILVSALIDRAGILLVDPDHVCWAASELLNWLNDGQREIVSLVPSANPVSEATQLSPGTKQTLPADKVQLIDIVRNMGADGLTPGRPVSIIEREELDVVRPGWHTDTASMTVRHFCYDGRDPRTFYVSPPQPDPAGYVELVTADTPGDCPLGGTINMQDVYANALLEYMIFRAYSKDGEWTRNNDRANAAYMAMQRSLGLKATGASTFSPNKNAPPFGNVPAEKQ